MFIVQSDLKDFYNSNRKMFMLISLVGNKTDTVMASHTYNHRHLFLTNNRRIKEHTYLAHRHPHTYFLLFCLYAKLTYPIFYRMSQTDNEWNKVSTVKQINPLLFVKTVEKTNVVPRLRRLRLEISVCTELRETRF